MVMIGGVGAEDYRYDPDVETLNVLAREVQRAQRKCDTIACSPDGEGFDEAFSVLESAIKAYEDEHHRIFGKRNN